MEKLLDYFIRNELVSRNEALQLLENRDFGTLCRDYVHYWKRTEKVTPVKSNSMSDVLAAIQAYVIAPNETEPYIFVENEEDETVTCIFSNVYEIEPESKCYSLANCWFKSAVWKLEHQPNGKDAIGYRKILES